jgi:hypothetical protein
MKNPLSSNRKNRWPAPPKTQPPFYSFGQGTNQKHNMHKNLKLFPLPTKRLRMDPKVEPQHDHQNITYLHVLIPCTMPDNMFKQLAIGNQNSHFVGIIAYNYCPHF